MKGPFLPLQFIDIIDRTTFFQLEKTQVLLNAKSEYGTEISNWTERNVGVFFSVYQIIAKEMINYMFLVVYPKKIQPRKSVDRDSVDTNIYSRSVFKSYFIF